MSPEHYWAIGNARYVLVDDDGARAIVTALWLKQMGWGDVTLLQDGPPRDDARGWPGTCADDRRWKNGWSSYKRLGPGETQRRPCHRCWYVTRSRSWTYSWRDLVLARGRRGTAERRIA
ncbi:MAG: hypothetical protein ACI9W2_003165 [Gammaproteobacteria bacterium]|jgi:hypothetical protein